MATKGQDTGGTVYIRPVVDASGVAEGVSDIKREFASIPAAAEQAAQGTNKSLATLGGVSPNFDRLQNAFSGVTDSVRKMVDESDRKLKTFVKQIENTAAIGTLTEKTADKYAATALLRGYDPAIVQPYIEGLRKLAQENKNVADVAKYEADAQKQANAERVKAAAIIDNFARSVQSAKIEYLALGKTVSEKFQIRAVELGIDKDAAVQRLQADLKAAEVAAAASANKIGQTLTPALQGSALQGKALNAALRQVPAQLTDIVVSLQGGQAPLTVLLQQGGQLKDIFGSVGGAARALGGYIAGLVSPFTVVGASVGAFAYAAYQASEDVKALRESLILTGTQGVTSLAKLDSIANNLNAIGVSTGTASEALVTFVNAGVRVDDQLQAITKAAIDLERVGGPSVEKTAEAFAKLANDPLASFEKLTLATYQQVEALLEQGKKTEAAKVAQEAFLESVKGTAGALDANLGPLDRSIEYWKRQAASVWDNVKALSTFLGLRSKPGDQELAELQTKRDRYKELGHDTTEEDKRLDYLKRAAAAGEQANKNLQREAELKKLLDSFNKSDSELVKQTKRNQLLTDNNRLLEAGLITQKQYNDALARFDGTDKKKPATSAKEALTEQQRSLASYVEALQGRLAKEEKLTEIQKAQNFLSSLGASGQIAQVREMVLGAAQKVDALNETEAATKAGVKAYQEYQREQEKIVEGYKRSADATEKSLQKFSDEEQALQLVAERNITLAQAVAEVELARLREVQAQKLAEGADGETLLAIQREIEAREKLASAIGRKEYREASKKAADQAAADWKRAAEKIQDSITDALLRAFESGKGFAEAMRDTIVNMFKTMVLRPVVQATVGGALSLVGPDAAASAVTGGGSSSGGGIGFNPLGSIASKVLGSVEIGGASLSALGSSFTTGITAGFNGTSLAGAIEAYSAASMEGVASMLSLGESIGGFAAALGPVGLAIGGIAILAALFGGGGRYVQSTGESVSRYDPEGKLVDRNDVRYGYANNAGADKLVDGIQQTYVNAAEGLGINMTGTQFSYGGNDAESDSGKGKFRIQSHATLNGVGKSFDSGEIDNADGALALAANRAVLSALTGSELPKYLVGYFDKITSEQIAGLDEKAITETLNTAMAYKELNSAIAALPFENLKDQTYTVYKALTDASGGLQQFGQNLQTFYTNFFDADEQRDQLVGNINKALTDAGLDVDVSAITRAQYRALVEAQDLTTESGQEAYAALLQMAGGVAQLTQQAQVATDKIANSIKKLQAETASLEVALLQAQGLSAQATSRQREIDTEGMSAAEIALYDHNQALRAQIAAVEAAKQAAADYASAQAQAAQDAANAAEELRSAWQSVTDTIFDEVKRIRELMGQGAGAQSLASAQANYAITLAQAQAGDQNAAKLLPELSQTMLKLAEAQATSLVQLRALQGQTAGSLEALAKQYASQYGLQVPQFAVGTNVVPQDMLAMVHKGEAIVPAAYNPALNGDGGQQAMVEEIRALRTQVAGMQAQLDSGNANTKRTAEILNRVTRGGDAMQTQVFA